MDQSWDDKVKAAEAQRKLDDLKQRLARVKQDKEKDKEAIAEVVKLLQPLLEGKTPQRFWDLLEEGDPKPDLNAKWIKERKANWKDKGITGVHEYDQLYAVAVIPWRLAPKGLVFYDEVYWGLISNQMSGKEAGKVRGYDKDKNIERENKAAKTMLQWRKLAQDGKLDLNVFYLSNADDGPNKFLKTASAKGYGSINLFFGHGDDKGLFDIKAALKEAEEKKAEADKKLKKPDETPPPLFVLVSCYASYYNEKIPPKYRLKNAPKNDGLIQVPYQLPQVTKLVEEIEKIRADRKEKGQKIQINLYFGEQMAVLAGVQRLERGRWVTRYEWPEHPERFIVWKWKD